MTYLFAGVSPNTNWVYTKYLQRIFDKLKLNKKNKLPR